MKEKLEKEIGERRREGRKGRRRYKGEEKSDRVREEGRREGSLE